MLEFYSVVTNPARTLSVVAVLLFIGAVGGSSQVLACPECGCHDVEESTSATHEHDNSAAHSHAPAGAGVSIPPSYTRFDVPVVAPEGTTRFVVVGDTQGLSKVNQLVTDMNHYTPEFFITAGDLVSTGSVGAWEQWKSLTDHFVGGETNRYAVPGNHDLPVGGDVQWQQTFNWLPDSQTVGGKKGIDQMDYYFDRGNSRFISVTTDSQAHGAGGLPAALDWFNNVLAMPSTQAMDHVFVISHHPVTYSNETGTSTSGAWWESMANSGIVDAVFTGHWHLYQPSQPDPTSPTWELVLGTGGGSLEGHPWQAQHGYTLIDVNGPRVESTFFGDADGDGMYNDIMDQQVIVDSTPAPNGLVAYYGFNYGNATNVDSAPTELAKQNNGAFRNGAETVAGGVLANALSVDGANDYAHGGSIGDYNMAILTDLTLSLHANFDSLASGTEANTLLAYSGRIPVIGFGGVYGPQESTNHPYHLSLTSDKRLRLMWEHDNAEQVVLTSTATANVDAGEWHHYMVTRDADTGEVVFYVDGTQLGATVPFAVSDLPTGGGNGFLHIGNGIDADTGFAGLIDELTIYNEVLLPGEVFIGPPPGDINGDGIVSGNGTGTPDVDDVTAFVNGWFTTGHGTVSEQIAHGDLNLDGITDLADWSILNSFDPSMGSAVLAALRGETVPEPSSWMLLAVGCVAFVSRGLLRFKRS